MTEKERGRGIRREDEKRDGMIGASFSGYRKPRADQWGKETLGMHAGTQVCVGAPMHL